LGGEPSKAKEAEVDHLTDLLVKSMENSNDPDFFGKTFLVYDDDLLTFIVHYNAATLRG